MLAGSENRTGRRDARANELLTSHQEDFERERPSTPVDANSQENMDDQKTPLHCLQPELKQDVLFTLGHPPQLQEFSGSSFDISV